MDSVCVSVMNVCANTDTVFADSNHSGKKVITNKSILVAGGYYVNDSLTLNNCSVYTAAGAQITIVTNGNLILNNTTIQSCDTMWRGIEVNNEARLRVLNNSFIRDANIGITAHAGATITVDSSSILDCIRGVYNAPVSSGLVNISLAVSRSVIAKVSTAFKPDYFGQPAHGTLPFAGMEVNNIIMTLGGSTGKVNEFYKLYNGLISHNSIVSVKRTRFQNIGKDTFYSGQYQGMAMAADANTTSLAKLNVLPEAFAYNAVDNAEYGIYAKSITLDVNYVHLLNVRFGAYCIQTPLAKSSSVRNSVITSSHIGIYFSSNPFAKFMTASNNIITINGSVSSGLSLAHFGIWMSEFNPAAPPKYFANDNTITLTNATHGIYAGGLDAAKIKYNNVKINGNGNGISVFANRKSSINCNTVTGTYANGATGNSNAYNAGSNSSVGKNTLYCNTADSTYRGFSFGGQNPSTIFRGNEMNNHWVGLYLNTGSIGNPTYIGIQPQHGNKWNTTSLSGFGGVNLAGNPYIPASRFDVDGALGGTYYPNVTPTPWFRDTTGSTFYCSSSTVCISPPPSLADTSIARLIAEGMFDSEEISDESRAIAEEYLYRELVDDSALWFSDSTYIAFMLEKQDENTGYLYHAEEYMRAAYHYDSTLLALLDSVAIQLALFADSISNIDKWHESSPELDVDSIMHVWTDKVNFLNQTINNINIQREGILTNNLENAALQNDYVVDGEVPEINAAAINELETLYIESGEDIGVLHSYYSTILTVATQCPYTGGEAVIRARTFVAMLNDSLGYDDANVCLQSGVYRMAQNSNEETPANNEIIVKPNPATDKIDIVLIGNFEGLCTIEIVNTLNEKNISEQMNCKEKEKTINITSLAQGVYTVKVSAGNKMQVQKITIIR
jgi:hypothetical protein